VSDDEVLACLDELRALRGRCERYAIVVDRRRSAGSSARRRELQADYVREGLPLSTRYLVGLAFVTESALHRGALTWDLRAAFGSCVSPVY
jgi:hypothetical protein